MQQKNIILNKPSLKGVQAVETIPVFDGIHAALEKFNQRRIAELERKKTSKRKRRRIELKVERTRFTAPKGVVQGAWSRYLRGETEQVNEVVTDL